METVAFGATGLEVSRLTFGCGAVGGLMTRGAPADQDRAVAWARENGINFFDTAASYGDGASEVNLGRALAGSSEGIIVSTKVGLTTADLTDVSGAVSRSIDASLGRLNLDHVDLFQLHNTIGRADARGTLDLQQVLEEVVPALDAVRDAGKARFLGFTAKGESADLHALIESEFFDSAQVFFNLLVPSAGEVTPAGYPAENYEQLLHSAKAHGVGAIGVRVLAGGALSGSEQRHPLGLASVTPIGSASSYATDVRRALRFGPLIADGLAASLPELAIRYAISNPALPTTEIGIASLDELRSATSAINKGPLSADTLSAIKAVQQSFVDEPLGAEK